MLRLNSSSVNHIVEMLRHIFKHSLFLYLVIHACRSRYICLHFHLPMSVSSSTYVCISIYLCLYLHLPMSATPSNNVCIYIYICLYLYLCQTVFNVWTYVFWWPSTCLPTYPYQCTPVHVIPTVKPIRLSVSHHRHFIPVSFFTSLSRCLCLNPEPTSKTKFYTVLDVGWT